MLFPPFIALRDLDATLQRSLIAGRITGWMQFHLSYTQLRDTQRHELHLWRKAGYHSRENNYRFDVVQIYFFE